MIPDPLTCFAIGAIVGVLFTLALIWRLS